MVVTVAAATATINPSINVFNAGSKLLGSAKSKIPNNKASEIHHLSVKWQILPEPDEKDLLPFIKTPLMEFLGDAYTSNTRGDSHVVYARPSIGKTMACFAFMKYAAPKTGCQALMITGAPKNFPYMAHIAKQLKVENQEDVLVDLVAGMRTVAPKPASVLILDEMNDPGVDNCNIFLVDVLMRFIYQNHQRIHLIVLTQNEEVADELSKLNRWEKIAPLNGLTSPTRDAVHQKEAEMPSQDDPTPWTPAVLEWSPENLTKFIDSRFRDHDFEKDKETGIITWLREGMTPTNAEKYAEKIIYRKQLENAPLDLFEGTL